MSRIVTFYSYKGGVGRTSALANIAVLLAKYGKSVLLMDWDLEAPGLDRYFSPYIKAESKRSQGLIHLLANAAKEPAAAWEPFVTQIQIDRCPPISIIMSGDRSTDYIEHIRTFSWSDFFENRQGGAILDRWRREWKSRYDYVLVDSRTGITDIGGVCTVFLPDILVLVFTANDQSFEGALQVANGIQQARRDLAVPRPPLAVLPLPGRFDGRDEVDEASAWLDRFSRDLKPFYDVWLPKQFEPRRILELTKVPYVTKFSFGEPLAVLMHNISDPEFPGFYLDKVARLIATDFGDALDILEPGATVYSSTTSEIRSKLTQFPIDEESISQLLGSIEAQIGHSLEFCELLNEIGEALARQGRFDFAETCFRRSLDLLETTHPTALLSLINLARLMRIKGDLAEAERLYREALIRLRETSRPGDRPLNIVYMNLAAVLREMGKLGEAEHLYREALETSRPGDRALVYMNLAAVLREMGKLGEAEHLYREALKTSRPGDRALVYMNLAAVLREMGKLGEAEHLYREALKTSRPGDRALVYMNLAAVLREMGKLGEAEDLYREAVSILEGMAVRDSPELAEAQSNLAEILVHTGNLNEAKSLLTETLAILARIPDQEHPAVIRAKRKLAELTL